MVRDSASAPTEPGDNSYVARRADVVAFSLPSVPELEIRPRVLPAVTIGELVGAGTVEVLESPPTLLPVDTGSPMLSAKDIRVGRSPSTSGDPSVPGAVTTRPGDVLVVTGSGPTIVRACAVSALLAPRVALVRANPAVIDHRFLAGVLQAAADNDDGKLPDLFAVGFPRMPLAEQRLTGDSVVELMALDDAWRRQWSAVERLVREGIAGLAGGRLSPGPTT
ncbi:hypothetical protein [Nocardia rosealba]|uniref:hypothetical protein n=1 Tax=Nocardia rosealba TaxID=2878563 RepID=UPI001CD9B783|nr:hypothetical protein [Nocardia rosealba]MCA2210578.1 hypothetical protein [Nocardia rosealba]